MLQILLFPFFPPAFGGNDCVGPLTEEIACNGSTPVQTQNDTQICYSNYSSYFTYGAIGPSQHRIAFQPPLQPRPPVQPQRNPYLQPTRVFFTNF